MALTFISETSSPSYIAVFSDIVNGTIDGLSQVGSVFRSLLIVGGTSGHKGSGGMSPFSTEFIIPPTTQMYVKYSNLDGNDSAYNVLVDFYEA